MLELSYWTWIDFIALRREKYSDYLTGFALILSYVGLGLEKYLD